MGTISAAIQFPLRIAVAAGERAQDVSPWAQDADASNGTGAISEWTGAVDVSNVTSPAPDAVYRCGWTSNLAGTPITYTITGLTAGRTYTVRCHFCAEAGRLADDYGFDLAIAGATTVTTNDIDPVAEVGTEAAFAVQTNVAANGSGQITITATADGGLAQLCGFEVLPVSGSFTGSPESYDEDPGSFTGTVDAYEESPGDFEEVSGTSSPTPAGASVKRTVASYATLAALRAETREPLQALIADGRTYVFVPDSGETDTGDEGSQFVKLSQWASGETARYEQRL